MRIEIDRIEGAANFRNEKKQSHSILAIIIHTTACPCPCPWSRHFAKQCAKLGYYYILS